MKKILLSLLAILIAFYFMPANAFAEVKDDELETYLTQISKVRGYDITKENYENYLREYSQMELSDFENLAELKDTLGPVINRDHNNLTEIYEDYDMNEQQLKDLLAKNGEAIDDYIYVDDLYFAVSDLQEPMDAEIPDMEEIQDELAGVTSELGLTSQEIQNLMDHFSLIEKDLNSPDMEQRLNSIAERMMSIDTENPTKAQIQEIGKAFDELLAIFKLKAKFYIVDGNKKTAVSAWELMQMEVFEGDYLLIELYNLDGKLLADLKITSDLYHEGPAKVGAVQETIKKEVKAAAPKAPKAQNKPKTVTGGKLPTTDSNHLDGALAGAALLGAGLFLYRRVRMS